MSIFFFFKQKTAYEMRISDWSSDVCSSDLEIAVAGDRGDGEILGDVPIGAQRGLPELVVLERTEIRVPVGGARVVWGRGVDERWKIRRNDAAGAGRAGRILQIGSASCGGRVGQDG